MSLFLFQQKIPFESVSSCLRVFEPGSPINPNDWARMHAGNITVGDLVFVFEPMYSPWSDSSSGIGVAEGDSFNVSAIAAVYKTEGGLMAYVINADTFEQHQLQDYFAQQVQAAKSNGAGFYYAVARSTAGITGNIVSDLGELDGFGTGGRRKNDNQPMDILSAFFIATSWGESANYLGIQPDIAQIGYCIFCDKEPATGSNIPDLRAYVQPLGKDADVPVVAVSSGTAASSARPAEPPVPPKQMQIPKIPSFFKQGKQKSADGGGKTPRIITPGSTPFVPASETQPAIADIDSDTGAGSELEADQRQPLAGSANETLSVLPVVTTAGNELPPLLPIQRLITEEPADPVLNDETEPVPALSQEELGHYATVLHDAETEAAMPPARLLPIGPPIEEPMSLPTPGQTPPTATAQTAAASPPPLPGAVPPPLPGPTTPQVTLKAPPPLPVFDSPAASSGSQQSSSKALPGIDWAKMLSEDPEDEETSHSRTNTAETLSPAPVMPAPSAPAVNQFPTPVANQTPPPIPAPAPALRPGRAAAPPPIPAPATAEPVVVAPPASAEQPAVASANTTATGSVQSTPDAPSLAELLGNISRAGDAPGTATAIAPDSPAAGASAVTASDTASGDSSLVALGPPSKKKIEPELQNRILKEQVQVKSGVAGLVSKLEQQASKASNRLEGQVDEIQSRLTAELTELLAKVTSAENRSARNAQDLGAELSERMDGAATQIAEKLTVAARDGAGRFREHEEQGATQLNEKHEYLRTSLSNSFDDVRARAESIAKTFVDNLNAQADDSSKDLEKLRDDLGEQLSGLYGTYEKTLQSAFDSFYQRLESANTSIAATVEGRYSLLQGQLAELHARCITRLEQMRQSYVNQLNRQFAVAQADVCKLRATALEETVIPRLRQHREELRTVTSEFQSKLAEDLEVKSDEKLAEFEPAQAEKRRKLAEVQHATTAIKDALEVQLRDRLQAIAEELKTFVETGIDQAQTAFRDTEEQLAEIDRAVRGLADSSSIEGDLELLNERNQVLAAMDDATEKAKEEVLTTLRTSVAGLEEKGKQLQEELISSMEEDAYRVRRASEQALHDIREAIKQAFAAIQTAQDERMPM
jgi:hypothetical protein